MLSRAGGQEPCLLPLFPGRLTGSSRRPRIISSRIPGCGGVSSARAVVEMSLCPEPRTLATFSRGEGWAVTAADQLEAGGGDDACFITVCIEITSNTLMVQRLANSGCCAGFVIFLILLRRDYGRNIWGSQAFVFCIHFQCMPIVLPTRTRKDLTSAVMRDEVTIVTGKMNPKGSRRCQ